MMPFTKQLPENSIFNFLSYLAIKKRTLPGDDVLVMNSIGNIKASLPWISAHKEAECYLDNDAPGKKTLDSIAARCPGVEVGDHSIEYGGFNDLNDYLKSMLPTRGIFTEPCSMK